MFYLFLPALNIHSIGFWMYVIVLLLIFGTINFGTGIFSLKKKEFDLKNRRNYYPFIAPVVIIGIMFIVHFINGPFFMANKYANRITITNGNFISGYSHVSPYFLVYVGQQINKGDIIANVGPKNVYDAPNNPYKDSSGNPTNGATTGPHLHFSLKINGKSVNPLDYLVEQMWAKGDTLASQGISPFGSRF